jgi:ParB family chromosome partitioning protein
MARKGGLGMGLGALFDDNTTQTGDNITTLRISVIEPNRSQPRQSFDEEKIASLAESIKRNGLLSPIIVKPLDNGQYRIIAGERRYRACKLLSMTEIPVTIKDFSDVETAEAALIENLLREDLNPIEEAAGIEELIKTHGLTQEALSKIIGRSRSGIANSLRLLSLPESVRALLISGELSAGQAKVLAGIDNTTLVESLAEKARDGGLTVRQLEETIKRIEAGESPKTPAVTAKNNYYTETALSLHEILGRKVKITSSRGGKKGKITLEFSGEDDLKKIAHALEKMK